MRKRSFSTLPIIFALGLVGCSGVDIGPASVSPQPTTTAPVETAEPSSEANSELTSEPEPEPWDGPTDGTWDYGDIGYGETYEGRLSDYRVIVVGLPEFGPLEDGRVTVTGTFNVVRHQDRGFDDEILDDLRFGFSPGKGSGAPLSETYGLYVDVECEEDAIDVDESTICRVSFEAPAVEMQNFYWWLNGDNVAAWPSQTA